MCEIWGGGGHRGHGIAPMLPHRLWGNIALW